MNSPVGLALADLAGIANSCLLGPVPPASLGGGAFLISSGAALRILRPRPAHYTSKAAPRLSHFPRSRPSRNRPVQPFKPFRRDRRTFHIIPDDMGLPSPAVLALSDRLATSFRTSP